MFKVCKVRKEFKDPRAIVDRKAILLRQPPHLPHLPLPPPLPPPQPWQQQLSRDPVHQVHKGLKALKGLRVRREIKVQPVRRVIWEISVQLAQVQRDRLE